MSLAEAARMAWHDIRAHHVRGALTCTGVIVGVGAIIVIAGLGIGLRASLTGLFGPLTTQIVITPADSAQPGVNATPRDLTVSDVAALRNLAAVPDEATVTGVVSATEVIRTGARYASATVQGVPPEYLALTGERLATGRLFTASEGRDAARVVVLGAQLVANLFNGDSHGGLGTTVWLGRTPFRVIGTLAANGQDDSAAIMPSRTARTYLAGAADRFGKILVTATSANSVGLAVEEVTHVLAAHHHIRDPLRRDFTIKSYTNIITTINQQLLAIGLFILAAAALSLIVGLVGITNVMLVAVTERTREIGIRRAVGARRTAILRQFLLESCVLAGTGGVCGVIVGTGMTLIAARVLPRLNPQAGVPQPSWPATFAAFALSVAIGIIAGTYPALRAAQVTPIEALRYE